MNIFVAKLSYYTTEDQLRFLFEQYGEVSSVKIINDPELNRSKGFGFVEMPDKEQAFAAIDNLHDTEVDGRQIVVKEAEDRRSGGGGGGNSGGPRKSFGGPRNEGGGGFQRREGGNQGGNPRFDKPRKDRFDGGGY